jgi:hypothetical protein
VITTDVADANDPASRNPKTARFQAATQKTQQLKAEEAQVMATLPPPGQAQYSAVSAALAQTKNPVAQLALQQLLFEGTLQTTDSHGGTLLANLATLANPKTPLAPGLDRGTLLSEMVQELAQPSSIDQAQRNTCGATTASIYLANTRPAEYARLVNGLASPGGQVNMVEGSLQRVADTTTDDHSGRTSTQRLLEPALMDYADGALLTYDNTADKHELFGLPTVPGVLPSMMAKMLTGLMGRKAEAGGGLLVKPGQADLAKLEASTRADLPVPTMINYAKDSNPFELHWVLATKVDAQQVTLVNPWGREETMPRAEFDRRLKGLALPG